MARTPQARALHAGVESALADAGLAGERSAVPSPSGPGALAAGLARHAAPAHRRELAPQRRLFSRAGASSRGRDGVPRRAAAADGAGVGRFGRSSTALLGPWSTPPPAQRLVRQL